MSLPLSAVRKNIPDIIANAWQFNLAKRTTMHSSELNHDAENFLRALNSYQYQPGIATLEEILKLYFSSSDYGEREKILEKLQQRLGRFEQKRYDS